MDSPGIEPGAFCVQDRYDTTTPQTLFKILKCILISMDAFDLMIMKKIKEKDFFLFYKNLILLKN